MLLALHRLFPDAPVFTSVFDPTRLPAEFAGLDVRTSFLQRIPGAQKRHQALLPLMPLAFESFDLSGFDLVISSHHAAAKGVITGPHTRHLSYVHTPMRYAWDLTHDYQATMPGWKRALAAPVLSALRVWDAATANRVDHFLANSRLVADRVAKHYRRPATVLHPPIRVADFTPGPAGEQLLVVSRLVPYKRVDLAVAAASATGVPLHVVGDGPEYRALKAMAGPSVKFLGHLTDAETRAEYAACRAFVFPAFEDFGLTPLEAMAAGKPVLAYGRGGALETVVDGVTGLFFGEQSAESLVAAMRRFEGAEFSPEAIRRHAGAYDEARFEEGIRAVVDASFARWKETGSFLDLGPTAERREPPCPPEGRRRREAP